MGWCRGTGGSARAGGVQGRVCCAGHSAFEAATSTGRVLYLSSAQPTTALHWGSGRGCSGSMSPRDWTIYRRCDPTGCVTWDPGDGDRSSNEMVFSLFFPGTGSWTMDPEQLIAFPASSSSSSSSPFVDHVIKDGILYRRDRPLAAQRHWYPYIGYRGRNKLKQVMNTVAFWLKFIKPLQAPPALPPSTPYQDQGGYRREGSVGS